MNFISVTNDLPPYNKQVLLVLKGEFRKDKKVVYFKLGFRSHTDNLEEHYKDSEANITGIFGTTSTFTNVIGWLDPNDIDELDKLIEAYEAMQ